MCISAIFWGKKFPIKLASAVAFFKARECLLFSSFARSARLICCDRSTGFKVMGGLPDDTAEELSLALFEEGALGCCCRSS